MKAVASPLFHLGCSTALETREQIRTAGIEDFLSPDGVAVIEWAERLEALALPQTSWKQVRIEILNETSRKIVYDDPGS